MGGGGANSLNSPKTDEKKNIWTTPTYKTFDDYFTVFDITKENITENGDVTGDGSANNPYLVHSTRGFLYLMNNSMLGHSLNNKYIKLNSDIVLNNEIFDENGNPSGGDGIVYNWKNLYYHTLNMSFDGNGHTIFNPYNNFSMTESWTTLLGGDLKEVKNLNISGIYIKGKNYVCGIAAESKYVANVKVTGNVVGNALVYGFVANSERIENSQNYAKITALTGDGCAGFTNVLKENGVIENCVNYGDVISIKNKVAGFVADAVFGGDKVSIKNCINYGNIKGQTYIAGFVGSNLNSPTNNSLTFVNCVNYGDISGTGAGGILGYGQKNLTFVGCENYGKIKGNYSYAQIVGAWLGDNAFVSFSDIVCNSLTDRGLVEGGGAKYQKVIVKNVHFISNDKTNCKFVIWKNGNSATIDSRINIENVVVDFEGNNKIALFEAPHKTSLFVKNVIFNIDSTVDNAFYSFSSVSYDSLLTGKEYEGIIVNKKNFATDYYFGSDFSGFYCDWKTGEIKIKALSGKGFYQGKINENWFVERGFVERTI